MTSWKKILAKERGPHDSWATAMKRKFERVLRELEDLKQNVVRRAAENENSYRRKISEGTRRGLDRARRRGVKLGGARPRKSKVSLDELRRLGYSGWVVVENEAPLGPVSPFEYAVRDRAYLKGLGL